MDLLHEAIFKDSPVHSLIPQDQVQSTCQTREVTIEPILVNWHKNTKVVIDSHCGEKHQDHMSEGLILQLVGELDGKFQVPMKTRGSFSYFESLLMHDKKQYRLIWVMEGSEDYIGIINAYRDER